MISGHKDTDLIILSKIDDKTLFSFCKIENSYVQKLCNDENFWRERVKNKFGNIKKNEDRTWKNLYLNIVHYTNKYGIYKSMFKFNELEQRKKNEDLWRHFEFRVLKRVYSQMIKILRQNLTAHRFSQKERDESIKRHNQNINKAAKKALDMLYYNLEVIETDPYYLKEDLYDHVPLQEIEK